MEQYQVGILGGGPGGYICALRAAQLGLSVVLVEKERLGGTCLNKGCIPTKTLVKSAELWREIKHAEEFGIQLGGALLHYPQIAARKKEVVNTLVSGIEQLMKAKKITVLKGWGEVKEANRIEVTTETGKVELHVENLVLATGSVPTKIPVPGVDLPGVVTSEELLEQETLPDSLVVIGGGVIGLEFASIYHEFGVKVSVVEMLPSLLPNIDEEIPKRLAPLLKRSGLEILTKASVREIKPKEEGLVVIVEDGKGLKELPAQQVLLATGRRPSLSGIHGDVLGLELDRGAIKVNSQMQTSVPKVYALGDVVGGAMLAHVASMQGMVAAEHMAGQQVSMEGRAIPSAIFTYPEIAAVGETEQALKASGKNYKVSKFPFSANGKALALGEIMGLVKLLADEEGVVIGASIMGPQASSLIQECVLAVEKKIKAEELAKIIHAHPTLPEAIMEAAHGILAKPLHLA
ncbi:dihydrolipoyl dehydrogenase [Desulfitobacterium chlororespirans]|uniref:Dihydrolipoyl dehydrogenase n=1 Tax=Desulfitobacterium chlororespirans DSM 11544 TaxID=1121395 RepID=A0A1M7UE47_9FIRM|nr:dihydrolipoyl dehydrogenase [Desulfitobacterium chlororespirans]SHN81293.1 dihydrolipoamide dehydrogenase [Desulfitobacterium chlororespirans DSM 11544]